MARTEDEPMKADNPTAIGTLIARLEHLSAALHDRFRVLEELLAPIVEQTPPDDRVDPATIDYRSQTASNLLGIITRLERLDSAMAYLCDRIDL